MMLVYHTVGWGQYTDPISFEGYQMPNIYNGEFADINNHLLANNNALKQLLEFPAPRHKRNHAFLRNDASSFGLGLVSRKNYFYAPKSNNPELDAATEQANIFLTLAKKWNYYLFIYSGGVSNNPIPPVGNGSLWSEYQNFFLINNSNRNPDLPTSTLISLHGLKNGTGAQVPQSTCLGCTGTVPTPPANNYTINNNLPALYESNPWSPTFYTSHHNNTNAPAQNQTRQASKLLSESYYVRCFEPSITPGCTKTDPCYYATQNYLTSTYKSYTGQNATNGVPTKFFTPMAGRLPTTTPSPQTLPPCGNYSYHGQTFFQDGINTRYRLDVVASQMTRNGANGMKFDMVCENGEELSTDLVLPHTTHHNPYEQNDTWNAFSKDQCIRDQFTKTSEMDRLTGPAGREFEFGTAGGSSPYWIDPIDPTTDFNNRKGVFFLGLKNTQGFVDITERYKDALFLNGNLPASIGTFTYYAIDGHNYLRHHLWEKSRNVLSSQRGIKYSTPDFYTSLSSWKRPTGIIDGSKHGWGWIDDCRFTELKHVAQPNNQDSDKWYLLANRPSDELYAPYVAAGWAPQEFLNMRPAQWLGLLKAMSVAGAEYFHTGYFTDDAPYRSSPVAFTGNAALPPYNQILREKDKYYTSNMIWQATTPSYAQATMTRAQQFFIDDSQQTGRPENYPPNANSELLTKDYGVSTAQYTYALAATSSVPNTQPLVVARHLVENGEDSYLITASLQNSNGTDDLFWINNTTDKFFNPDSPPDVQGTVTVDIPYKNVLNSPVHTLVLNATRQGCTYLYKPNIGTMVQLDKWHEWKHPTHWSKSIWIEAELEDSAPSKISTILNTNAPQGNYTNFVSYVKNNKIHEYDFDPKQTGEYYVYVRASDAGACKNVLNARVLVKNEDGTVANTIRLQSVNFPPCPAGVDFQWKRFPITIPVNVINKLTYTLVIDAGSTSPIGSSAMCHGNDTNIDCFFITLGDPLPVIDGLGSDCNP